MISNFYRTPVSGVGNSTVELEGLLWIVLTGWMQFWFLHSLILVFLLDIFYRAVHVRIEYRLFIAILILFCRAFHLISFPHAIDKAMSNILYFEVGVSMATILVNSSSKWPKLVYLSSSLLCFIAFVNFGAGYGNTLRPIGAFSGIFLCIGLSKYICFRAHSKIRNFLQILGKQSLQIFILHVIFASGCRILLNYYGVDKFYLHLSLGVFSAFVGAFFISHLDEHFLGKRLFRFPIH